MHWPLALEFSEVLVKKSSVPTSVLLKVGPGNLHFKIAPQVILRHSKVCRDRKLVRNRKKKKKDLTGKWKVDIPTLVHLFIWCVLSTSIMPGPGYTLWLEHLSLSLWGLHSMINKDTLLVYPPLTTWPIWQIWLPPFSWDPPLPSIQFSKWVSARVHCPVSLLFCCLSLAVGFLSAF